MLKLTMKEIPKAVIVDKVFSIECPDCCHETQFRIMGPMCCANCLAMLPEGVNVMLMVEDRYDYFVSDEELKELLVY